MLQPHILFKGPALMVVNYPLPDNEHQVILPVKHYPQPISISTEAAVLLLDYLKVSKAFFAYCAYTHKQLHQLYASIAVRLVQKQEHNHLHRTAVSSVIQELGCTSDWMQWYPHAF
jgi:hypothetical protein